MMHKCFALHNFPVKNSEIFQLNPCHNVVDNIPEVNTFIMDIT